MRIINDNMGIADFEAWSGGKDTKETILQHGKGGEFDQMMDELYPDGLTDTQLNDILWHDSDWVLESLGIDESEEE
jgi:hypothetical protein